MFSGRLLLSITVSSVKKDDILIPAAGGENNFAKSYSHSMVAGGLDVIS